MYSQGFQNNQRSVNSEDVSKLYSFQTLPAMELAIGETQARQLLNEIVEDEMKEQDSKDFGCICEIDLTKSIKISKIMSRLLYPSKTNTGSDKDASKKVSKAKN